MNKEERIMKKYRLYLIFMLIACGGAFIWQFCLPQLGGMFTSWGNSIGWQREISLLTNFSLDYIIHILGIFEVMILGGVWGTYLLVKNNK